MNDLLETYPAVTEVIKTWFVKKMIESLNTDKVPEEFKEHMRKEGVNNDKLAIMLRSNPRMLFDVFDNYGLYINIIATPLENVSAEFSYIILPLPRDFELTGLTQYSERKNAEKDAIIDAIKLLNNKLCDK